LLVEDNWLWLPVVSRLNGHPAVFEHVREGYIWNFGHVDIWIHVVVHVVVVVVHMVHVVRMIVHVIVNVGVTDQLVRNFSGLVVLDFNDIARIALGIVVVVRGIDVANQLLTDHTGVRVHDIGKVAVFSVSLGVAVAILGGHNVLMP